jgi:uroporphyrinogen III methyltransferase/synthase
MAKGKNPTMGDRGVGESPRSLAGKRIVVTRARAQASILVRRIEELGGEVIEFPTIEIQAPDSYIPLDDAIAKIHTYDWLIFTSVNGVEQFLSRLQILNKSIADLTGVEVGAIGPETAKRVAIAGVRNCLVPKQYQAEGILEVLEPETMRGKRVLIPRAAQARDILPETLRQWGAKVDVVEAYRTAVPKTDSSGLKSLLKGRGVDMVTFTSSSTVINFVGLLQGQRLGELLDGIGVACIGPITKKTVEEMGGRADVVSEEFTITGLVDAIVDYFERKTNAESHDRRLSRPPTT